MYRWANPHEWLQWRLRVWSASPKKLLEVAMLLAGQLEPDDIQDIFDREMQNDGYFEQIQE